MQTTAVDDNPSIEIKASTKDVILNNDKRQPRERVTPNKRKREPEQKTPENAKKQAFNKFVYRQETGGLGRSSEQELLIIIYTQQLIE